MRVYSIFDREREMYSNPFYTEEVFTEENGWDVAAKRIFKAQLFDRGNLIAMFPDKFDLCFLGTFDEYTGEFEGGEALPIVVINGNEAIDEMREEKNKNESSEN